LGSEIKKKTLVVNGLSKSHAMTGWRVGFTAGPKEIIRAMTNIQSQSTSNPNSIAQKAAVEALTGPQDFVQTMRNEFDRRRRFLVSELNAMPDVSCIVPTGAFYAFPNISGLFGKVDGKPVFSSSDLSLFLLEDANVALVPGEAFGDDNCVRLSYATSMENLKKGVERIRNAVGKLK
jgi:aspartate aminotransferase